MCPVEIETFSTPLHKMVDFLDRTVVDADMETLALHIQRQVLAHHGQTHKSNV